MSKKKQIRSLPSAPAAPPVPASAPLFGWADALALVAALICLGLTWSSRAALNPDGVSYLDLARLARIGDWPGFVQGYWSPLYPALIAALTRSATTTPLAQVGLAHLVNGVAAVAGIALAWWWGRRSGRPFFAL